MEIVLISLMVLGGVLILIGIIMALFNHKKIETTPIEDMVIPKSTYVQLVVDWCHDNISHGNLKQPTKRKPTCSLKYNKTKTAYGAYFTPTNHIVIYVNNHTDLNELTNTVIHEYVHSRQKSRSFDKEYDRYDREMGYNNNPFEIEADEIANKYQDKCIQELMDTYNIV